MTAADADASVAPRHWEADVLLRDGRTAHIRPIRPEDADLLVDFYSRVSDQSKYYRFFSPMPNLSDRDVARFTHVDHVDRVAFVMTVVGADDRASAATTAICRGGHQGEPVEAPRSPSWWRTPTRAGGSGSSCSSTSPRPAASAAIDRFVAEVLPDNHRMIQTFRDAGYRLVSGFEDGVVSLEFPIDADRHGHRRDEQPRAPRGGGVDRVVLQPAVDRGHRRLAAVRTPSARRWSATSCSATTPAGCTS